VISRRAALLSLAAVACTRRSTPDAGAPTRIVSLSPSTTEAVAAVGALALLVGRSRYCDYPPEVKALPEVGGYVDPSYEAIFALAPTLVVGARGPAGASVIDKLVARGIDTYFPETESLAQIEAMIAGMGARTGHEADAKKVNDDVRTRIEAIGRALAAAPKVRVVLLFGVTPVVAAGARTFASELLERAGATNAVTGDGYPTLDVEALVALDPDVLLDGASAASHGGETIPKTAAGWRDMRAVRSGRVVALADESVLRPGPRVALGVASLARAIHPEITLPS